MTTAELESFTKFYNHQLTDLKLVKGDWSDKVIGTREEIKSQEAKTIENLTQKKQKKLENKQKPHSPVD